jgi:hypothetical protein
VVQFRLPLRDNRALNGTQTQGFTDYYEVIFKEKDADRYYAGTGRTGDTVNIQVSGDTTYEILILGGYESQYRKILLGSVFANKLDGDRATYGGTGIYIAGGTLTRLSFTLDPLLLNPTEYTSVFSGAGSLNDDGRPERINGRLAYIADTQNPLKHQGTTTDLSITVALKKVPSLVRAQGGTGMSFAEVQGRFEVYDPAAGTFIYYSPMGTACQTLSENEVSLEFTLSAGVIQGITPVDGDWKFDFEATYYGFGDPAFGGTKWTIRNGLGSELDREGGMGGGLWVHFGNGNGFRDQELSVIGGTVEQSGSAVPGAEVQLLNQDGTVYKAVVSGWDGKYSFGDIAPGTYILEASLIEPDTVNGFNLYFDAQAIEVATAAGGVFTQDLDLEPGYSVSYGLNGGGGTPPLSRKVLPNTGITLPGAGGMIAPPGPGKTFYYWDDGSQILKAGTPYTVNGHVRFKAFWGPFLSVEAVAAYLDSFTGAEGTAGMPIPIMVEVNLSSQWAALLDVLAAADKDVALDLSPSTMTGTEFNPGSAAPGKAKIVSLTLPDTAESIRGESTWGALSTFTALESVSGKHIKIIGQFAFKGCPLSTVNFPEATNIGVYAFELCSMSTVSLPKATNIGEGAFQDCSQLSIVNLPEATNIGFHAFMNCSQLTSITINGGCTINSSASIRDNFVGYYNADNGSGAKAAGLYIFDGGSWTGPF